MFPSGRSARRAAAVVAAAATAVTLAGCGGTSASGSTSKSLTYWSMWNQPEPQAQVIQKAADAFEKQTGIHVNIKWVGRKVLTNVSADLNGGTLPDLTDQDAGELTATFGSTNAALGLGDVVSAPVTGENNKVSDVLPMNLVNRYKTADGQPLMVPYEVISSALWYNASQLPSVTTNPPTTWSDFMAFLNKEKAAGRAPLALDADQQEYTSYWWTWAAVRHGGPGVVKNAIADKTGAGWDNPALLAAAQDIQALVRGGYFTPGYTGTKWPAEQSAWASGENKTDFLLMGSWAPSETAPFAAKNPVKFQYRSVPFPQVSDGKGNNASEASLIGFAIPKKAKEPTNAEKFIEFFLNKDQLSGISTTALNLTPRSDVSVPPQLADLKKQVLSAGSDTFMPDDGVNAAYPQFTSQFDYPTVQKLLLGQLDAKGFISTMKQATIDYWKNQG